MRPTFLTIAIISAALAACAKDDPDPAQYGADPSLPEQRTTLLPSVEVSSPVGWGDDRPQVPPGYKIEAIATNLKIPRQTLVLPNGDILVAEGKGGADAPPMRPKDLIAGLIIKKGTSGVKSGDRLTLLRDADGDGRYEGRSVFADNLNAPYGLALVGDGLFVANQDSLVRFEYRPGQVRAIGLPRKIIDLPSYINHHWTKAMTASVDGRFLYVGIGSNSNVGERGLAAEEGRAMVWQVNVATGDHRPFATGLRNPTALAVQPGNGQPWAVVNERDELGPNLVPDYMTALRNGGFYGWPYSYWGNNVDRRVQPANPTKVGEAIRPDYSLGSHRAPLGIAFSTAAMGINFGEGVFLGQHGSWNRATPVGYKVVFVRFRDGRPSGPPIDFVGGFLKNGKARGRPVGVTVDPRGALIVADDLSNTIWRIAPIKTLSGS